MREQADKLSTFIDFSPAQMSTIIMFIESINVC